MTGVSDVDVLTKNLESTGLTLNGISFAHKSLNLNTAADAKVVVDAIENCEGPVEYLCLEGNTVGVEAAEAIGVALEKCSSFRRALWNNMFTQRLKTEIPHALKALGKGLIKAGAKLEILDLSDNAMGPIGVEGIVELLTSEVCWSLKELRLNNLGLGITGVTKLAQTLEKAYNISAANGNPMRLRVFIGGRNRLENEGAIAISKVFGLMKSLEEIQIPQNGIYSTGIQALSKSLALNPNLRILNINDNTPKSKGTEAITEALLSHKNLRVLDLGDCLLQTKGARYLVHALKKGLNNIEVLNLEGNEISANEAMDIMAALPGKPNLKSIKLNENEIGKRVNDVKRIFSEVCSRPDVLELDAEENSDDDDGGDEDDVSDERDEEDEDAEEKEDGDEEEEDDDGYDDVDEEEGDYDGSWSGESDGQDEDYIVCADRNSSKTEEFISPMRRTIIKPADSLTIADNVSASSIDPIAINSNTFISIKSQIQNLETDERLEELLKFIARLPSSEAAPVEVKQLGIQLYEEMFSVAKAQSKLSVINNLLPAYLGLIKLENKKDISHSKHQTWNLEIFQEASTKPFFPKETADIIHFISKNLNKN